MAKFTYTVRCELEDDQKWDGDCAPPPAGWSAYTVIIARTCKCCDMSNDFWDVLGMVWLPHDGDSAELRDTVRDMLGSRVQWRNVTFA